MHKIIGDNFVFIIEIGKQLFAYYTGQVNIDQMLLEVKDFTWF